MKPLSIIAFLFAVFLIVLGVSSRQSSGGLSYAVLGAGILILIFLGIIRLLSSLKAKKETSSRENF